MAIKRQANFLNQQRIDVPDLRSIESAVTNDFDDLAGKLLAGKQPIIVRGWTISTANTRGNPADQLQLASAGGIALHFGASESGTVFTVPDTELPETLSVASSRVTGSFTAGIVNYVGIDLQRTADTSTVDNTKFLDADTSQETAATVPKARTLDFTIIISTQPFSVTSNVCPVAKVLTDSSNNVVSITDARKLMFRLGAGGDNPDAAVGYEFTDADRAENPITFSVSSSTDPFSGGDKEIRSMKEWMDAVMTMIWEVKSGPYWYSPTARDNIKTIFTSSVLASNNDNFDYIGNLLYWKGVRLAFENSPVYYNTIVDEEVGQEFTDGDCLYVDLQRDSVAALIPVIAPLVDLSTPSQPGSRFILAWCVNGEVFVRDKGYQIGRAIPIADTANLGVVILNQTPGNPALPKVVVLDADDQAVNTGGGAGFSGFVGTAGGAGGAGVNGQGGNNVGSWGVYGMSGTGLTAAGVRGDAQGTAYGVWGEADSSSAGSGMYARGYGSGGYGIYALCASTFAMYAEGGGSGSLHTSGAPSSNLSGGSGIIPSIYGRGRGSGAGVEGYGGATGGPGLYGTGGGTGSLTSTNVTALATVSAGKHGVVGRGRDTAGAGGWFVGGGDSGSGVRAESNSGDAIYATSTSGSGILASSSSSYGVYGTSTSSYGVFGSAPTGVYGLGATAGVKGQGASTAPGIWGVSGTSTAAGTGADVGGYFDGPGTGTAAAHIAIQAQQNIKLAGSDPVKETGFANTLTPMNIPKAWGRATGGGSGAATVPTGGFNCTIARQSDTLIRVSFVTPMASDDYVVIISGLGTSGAVISVPIVNAGRTANYFEVFFRDININTDITLDSTFEFVVFGEQ